MKKRIMLKRGIAYLLAVAMVVGLMVCTPSDMMNVQAADGTSTTTGKTITGLGTSGIADPVTPTGDSDAWKGSYVYFGTYDTDGDSTAEPVKYRVLDSNTTVFGGTTMLLDCDSILWAGTNPSSVFDADSNVWADSDIRTYLNGTFLTDNFSMAEQSAIEESTKSSADSSDGDGWSSLNYAELNNDKIFFLDAKEATNESYGYSNTDYDATNRVKTGGNAYWWLRSARTDITVYAGFVNSDGIIFYDSVNDIYVGVSPALNVNLSSVLFSSVISGTAGETGAEYKLTLLDSDMTIAGNGTVTRNGDTVIIPYNISGTNSANATQVSVLLLDKEYTEGNTNDAEVIYYGALDDNGSFTLPSDLSDKVCGSDYYAYIVAEDVNGEYETDYASEPVKVSIPWLSKTMNLGTNGMVDPIVPSSTSDAWTGSYVYFGTYDGNGTTIAYPVKYRVLDSKTTVFGGTTMLLDCDSILWAGTNPSSVFDTDSNVWADSDIRAYLNGTFLTDNFSMAEQNAIASSTKSAADSSDGDGWSYLNYAELNNDKIFFLDAKEATNESYGYSNTDDDATNRVKTGGNAYWWLRSADTSHPNYAGIVGSDGGIFDDYVLSTRVGVSPALNVNLSSVLFTSASGTSKSSALTAQSSQTGTTTGTEWKLTLQDAGKTIKITDNEKVIRVADGTITVPYTYTDTATSDSEKVNQISVMITDKEYTESDAEILYYGTLQNIDLSNSTGTGTFTLPSALNGQTLGTDYYVYVIAEYVNTTNATDYASVPVEITNIYDEISSISVGVDAPVAGTALDTTATTSDTEYSATTVTWKDGDITATGNADYDTAYTVNITLTADSEYVFADGVTATVNNHTATVTDINDGTITVSYTFEKTQIGTITHTAAGYEGTYDGQSHGITVAVTVPSDTTVTYSTDGSTYSATNPTFTDAGIYTVYYKVTKDKYEDVTGEAIVTITKKALSVTADNQTITEGDSVDNSKYSVSGLVSGDTLSTVTLTPSTTEVTDNGTIEVSGAKIVNADGKDVTANYNITYTAGKLVVNEVEGEPQPDEPAPDGPQPDEPTPDGPQPDEPTPDATQPDESDEYEITAGADSEWTVDSDGSITITGNGDFAKFVGVKVDGKLIDEANYTAKSGPTIVTLKSSYLNTLSVGEHTFEIAWEDGSASTTFTVKQAETDKEPPNTGDNSSLGLWFVLLIGSGLTAVVLWKKKKYIVERNVN